MNPLEAHPSPSPDGYPFGNVPLVEPVRELRGFPLGTILLRLGLVPEGPINEALAECESARKPLGRFLGFFQCGVNLRLEDLLLIAAQFYVGFPQERSYLIHRIDCIDASKDLRLAGAHTCGTPLSASTFFLRINGKRDDG